MWKHIYILHYSYTFWIVEIYLDLLETDAIDTALTAIIEQDVRAEKNKFQPWWDNIKLYLNDSSVN